MELVKQFGLDEFLRDAMPAGRESVPLSLTALILVTARLCEPSSELNIAEHFYRQSALCDLLGVPVEQFDDNRLYRGLDALLPHKPALEAFLKQRFGELFAVEYDLLLYDVTSTYFENRADANPLAKRGYSRDHRPDCKQVCIGLVVTRCGLPLGYEVFAGNHPSSKDRFFRLATRLLRSYAVPPSTSTRLRGYQCNISRVCALSRVRQTVFCFAAGFPIFLERWNDGRFCKCCEEYSAESGAQIGETWHEAADEKSRSKGRSPYCSE